MATPFTISQAELKRVADLAYDGQSYKLFLANNDTGLGAEDTAAAWLAKELAVANGYAAVTGTLTGGAYDGTDARYEFHTVVGGFAATGAGFSYNTVVLRIGTEASVAGIFVVSPAVTLLAGQAKTYAVTLGSND